MKGRGRTGKRGERGEVETESKQIERERRGVEERQGREETD